ncbi:MULTISPECIES: signal peptide peptidase SppA [unclassified Helicobacter]|uniref:signal peptide peptidase SppA n=1 Tax=unclassified Helicobacter TaxID=2593540 RepID=UPI001F5A2797|nr:MULTISPECIES: signal peptide peptidase SppA [unclassified Helicobacter]MCI2236201.1 signal peptide peptidase SppA [Helicobacter sp. CaF467b]MCI7046572.1 signal peptide peptidase SppA [Helicobacter sp.]MCI7765800.1 signal peptide peptidase SppA [Helicobacter sp.]MDY5615353.1 signal peptide peptidase SppA [Helicobacter sp.]
MKIIRILLAPLDFIMKYFKALVFLLIVFLIFMPSSSGNSSLANVARIDLKGMIIQSDSFLEELSKLENNPNIKGVLLVIDSPGGTIPPSVEISEAVKRIRSKKPIVVYAQGSMASGSYLAGVWADRIIANKGALVGSIGVILNGVDVSELAEKLGIKTQILKAGIYKEAGTFMRPWNKQEEEMLKGLIKEQYEMFVSEVVAARNLEITKEGDFAQGRVFSASNALKLGLVDSIGSIYEAQKILFELGKIQNPIWLQKSEMEMYLEKIIGENIALGIQEGIYNISLGWLKGY